MSILTKICVVIVAFGALGTAVMVTTLATAENNYRAMYEIEKGKLATAQTKLETSQALAADTERQVNQLRRELADAKDGGSQQALVLQGQLKDEKVKRAAAERMLAGIRAELAGIRSTAAKQKEMIGSLDKDLRESWVNIAKLEEVYQATRIQLKESEAKVDRYDTMVRNLREQMVDLRAQLDEKNKQLRDMQAGGTMQAATPVTYDVAVPKITGKISGLQEDIASVDVGTAQGLSKGMKLIIYRGADFVGYLKLETVRVNSAAGTITEKEMNPQAGDRVTTRLN